MPRPTTMDWRTRERLVAVTATLRRSLGAVEVISRYSGVLVPSDFDGALADLRSALADIDALSGEP